MGGETRARWTRRAVSQVVVVSLALGVLILFAPNTGALSPPTVSAVDPAIGTTAGGDYVDVVGANFVSGSTTVHFELTPQTGHHVSTSYS